MFNANLCLSQKQFQNATNPSQLSPLANCQVNGVTINVSGTSQWTYEAPTDAAYNNCPVPSNFDSNGFTSGNAPSGVYTSGEVNYFFNPSVYVTTVS